MLIMEDGIDGREASLRARKYFEEVHGQLSVIAFTIEEVEYNENEGVWRILCSFYPHINAQSRVRYEVKLDGKEGKVLSIKQLPSKVELSADNQ